MRRRFTATSLLRWIGSLLCILIVIAFAWSTRRALSWDSADSRQEIGLVLGSVYYGWRPVGWRLEDERYPSIAGWNVASYGGSPGLSWSIEKGSSRSWQSIGVPLWIPFLAILVPTAALWYRHRHLAHGSACRWIAWLTPDRPRKVTFGLVVAFCGMHVASLFGGWYLFDSTYGFFVDYRPGDPVYPVIERAAFVLFWTTPLWALLWAFAYTRLRNHLFIRQAANRCLQCGYNLTGNVSGVCPECGEKK